MKKFSAANLIIIILTISVISLAGILLFAGRDQNLLITRSAISNDETGKQVISGTVENKTSNKIYSQVRVDIAYLNAARQVVGNDSAQTNSVGPHMVWGFKEYVNSSNVAGFKIKVSSVHIFGLRW